MPFALRTRRVCKRAVFINFTVQKHKLLHYRTNFTRSCLFTKFRFYVAASCKFQFELRGRQRVKPLPDKAIDTHYHHTDDTCSCEQHREVSSVRGAADHGT